MRSIKPTFLFWSKKLKQLQTKKPFSITSKKVDYVDYPKEVSKGFAKNPQIIWLEFYTNDELGTFRREIQEATKKWIPADIKAEGQQDFRPHIKMGRIKRPARKPRLLRQFANYKIQLTSILLIESHKSIIGKKYWVTEKFPFNWNRAEK